MFTPRVVKSEQLDEKNHLKPKFIHSQFSTDHDTYAILAENDEVLMKRRGRSVIRYAQSQTTGRWVVIKEQKIPSLDKTDHTGYELVLNEYHILYSLKRTRERLIVEKHNDQGFMTYTIADYVPDFDLDECMGFRRVKRFKTTTEEFISGKYLSNQERKNCALSIVQAYHSFHQLGYVHVDVNSRNIRINEYTSEATLVDFEHARRMDTTLDYEMRAFDPPEDKKGTTSCTVAADIFRLSYVLEDLLFLSKRPFHTRPYSDQEEKNFWGMIKQMRHDNSQERLGLVAVAKILGGEIRQEFKSNPQALSAPVPTLIHHALIPSIPSMADILAIEEKKNKLRTLGFGLGFGILLPTLMLSTVFAGIFTGPITIAAILVASSLSGASLGVTWESNNNVTKTIFLGVACACIAGIIATGVGAAVLGVFGIGLIATLGFGLGGGIGCACFSPLPRIPPIVPRLVSVPGNSALHRLYARPGHSLSSSKIPIDDDKHSQLFQPPPVTEQPPVESDSNPNNLAPGT